MFKQPASVPARKFEVGHKLEVTDPTDPTVAYIASVVQVLGYKIMLRLDGCDSSSDFWRLASSRSIHHIGYSDTSGQKLQLPLGKILSACMWHTPFTNFIF